MLLWDLISSLTRWFSISQNVGVDSPATPRMTFTLRHQHAVSSSAQVALFDVDLSTINANGISYYSDGASPYSLRRRSVKVTRPSSREDWSNARLLSRTRDITTFMKWDEDDVPAPDVEDRETLLALAKMTNNAYVEPSDKAWYNLGSNWSVVRSLN